MEYLLSDDGNFFLGSIIYNYVTGSISDKKQLVLLKVLLKQAAESPEILSDYDLTIVFIDKRSAAASLKLLDRFRCLRLEVDDPASVR